MRQQRQRILVTGAAGFVGSHLCDHLRGCPLSAGGRPAARGRPAPPPTRSLSLARELLGWQPRVDSDEGLAATVASFDGLLPGEVR